MFVNADFKKTYCSLIYIYGIHYIHNAIWVQIYNEQIKQVIKNLKINFCYAMAVKYNKNLRSLHIAYYKLKIIIIFITNMIFYIFAMKFVGKTRNN